MAHVKSAGQVAIAGGQSLSGPINLGDRILCAVLMPDEWTAAGITVQASDDHGVTWKDMYDASGREVEMPAASASPGQRISINSSLFSGVDFLRFRSGTGALPVAQEADRTLAIISRKL